jgi:hypothetical protein
VQGKLYRWPPTLGKVYMWGDNRYGQLGLAKERTATAPVLMDDFLDKDWHGVFAGSRQTFWVSRVLDCPGKCNGHGICNHDTGSCTCEYPWTLELDCLSAHCPNNCSGQGECFPRRQVPLAEALSDGGVKECRCEFPYWDVDCSRMQCPSNCWGPDHGICNNTDGTCTCVGNSTVPCAPRLRAAAAAAALSHLGCAGHVQRVRLLRPRPTARAGSAALLHPAAPPPLALLHQRLQRRPHHRTAGPGPPAPCLVRWSGCWWCGEQTPGLQLMTAAENCG